jgi:acyl transferase domain-containing protein
MNTINHRQERIAIIGMSVRFPGADNCREFWQHLEAGKEVISRYTEEELLAAGVPESLVKDPNYVRAKGALKDVWGFDAGFFGYSPREAALMDPQQRLLLECSWEALEDAGYDPGIYKGAIGVYAGSGVGRYLLNRETGGKNNITDRFQVDISNNPDFLASRVAYKLNLTGPAISVQTACSTSLVAVHQACQALQTGDCEMALAGGVSLGQLEKSGYLYQPGMIYSPDGRCRAFDANAKGIVRGQGAGMVLLKRYEEAVNEGDHIYAVILSTAINNDGSNKIGYTTPSVEGQSKVIQQAHRKASISADSIGYIEAHGTGTLVGDPMELEGLIKAFRASTDKKQFCAIGSVKTNMGHLDAAAGIAGLIKAALCLYHRKLVPSLHFEQPNPYIDFKNSPFYVNTGTVDWKEGPWPRRAGISAFGIGGTNAHVLIEEAPKPKVPKASEGCWQLLPLSARTATALQALVARMLHYLRQRPLPPLPDIARTLQTGRRIFGYRYQVVCRNREEAIKALQQFDTSTLLPVKEEPAPVVFMFQGQGAFYQDMGRGLYEALPVFRNTVDECTAIMRRTFPERFENMTVEQLLGWINGKTSGELSLTTLFILQYALARHFMSVGIKPAALIGYSSGEYVAACLAGIFSLQDALTLVTIRWQLITQTAPGKMIAIRLPEAQTLALINDHHLPLDIAGTTSPGTCVVSGSTNAIGYLEKLLLQQGIKSHYLPINHAAHSRLLEPIREILRTKLASIKIQPPQLPVISNVTGTWMQATEVVTPDYWVHHLRHTVRFSEGLDCLFAEEGLEQAVFLEVGPGQVLSNLARQHSGIRDTQTLLFTMDSGVGEMKNEMRDLYAATGKLWEAGVDIHWQALPGKNYKHRVSLPAYPFERQTHKVTVTNTLDRSLEIAPVAAPVFAPAVIHNDGALQEPDILKDFLAASWKEALGQQVTIDEKSHFFRLGGDSLTAVKVLAAINRQLNTSLNTGLLVQYPEFGKLLHYIRQVAPRDTTQHRPTVTNGVVQVLKEGLPGKLPLVLVHPIGGDIYIFRDLVAALDNDQPVYAIQSPLLSGQAFPATTIEAMAEVYLEELSNAGITAPFVLGGASFGGVVAFEMAKLLLHRKAPPPLLVQIDAPAVPVNYTQDSAQILAQMLGNRLPVTEAEIRRTGDMQAQVAYVKELAIQRGHPELLPAQPEQYILTQYTNWNALLQYKPSPYDGCVLFFHPLEPAPRTPLGWQLFWEPLAGIYESHAVAGNHITMNYQTNVEAMATVLQQAIAQQGQLMKLANNASHEQSDKSIFHSIKKEQR